MAHPLQARAALAATIAALLLPLAACGGDEPGGADEPSASPSESASESPAPSEEPSSTVAPASGPLLELPNAELHVPEGWTKDEAMIDLQSGATGPDSTSSATLTAIEMPAAAPDLPLAELTRNALKSAPTPKPKVLDTVQIGEVDWYHLSGETGGQHAESFGTVNDGYQTTINFFFFPTIPVREREEVIATSLASFAWR
ncbi:MULTISPECIES: hypothetical protein [unclassified Nocardioides]|uniref:hypothetical protein n=1 Tax=unclassified Nocardioides TaxID=2615069 RepID=UPI00361AE6F3